MEPDGALNLPQWDDLLLGLVRWAGAPFAVVLLVYVFLWALSWIQAGTAAYKHGKAATQAVVNAVATRTTTGGRARFVLFIVSATFSLSAVSVVKLTLNYWGRSGSPYWDDWAWVGVLLSWNPDTVWYLATVAASITLLGIAHIRGSTFVAIAIAVVWVPLLVVSGLLGIFWTVAFVGNALLATLKALTQEQDPSYTFATASTFFVLAITAIGATLLGPVVWERIGVAFAWKKTPRAPATATARSQATVSAPSAQNTNTFNVVLDSAGTNRIQVIKAIRAITGLGLGEAKALVDSAPSLVLREVSRREADGARGELESAGAAASVRYAP